MEMVSMNNIYCSFCGEKLDKCDCRKSNLIETKVIRSRESKGNKKQQDEEQVK